MSSSDGATARPRRRHLMDPNAPQPVPRYTMSLTSVQRWVGSILAVSTIFHLAFGLDLAAWFLAADRPAAAFSLLGLAVVVGVIAMSVGLAIHRHRLLSWWLLIAPIPALIGVVVLMARWS